MHAASKPSGWVGGTSLRKCALMESRNFITCDASYPAEKGKHGPETKLEKCGTTCSGVRDFSGMNKYT